MFTGGLEVGEIFPIDQDIFTYTEPQLGGFTVNVMCPSHCHLLQYFLVPKLMIVRQ